MRADDTAIRIKDVSHRFGEEGEARNVRALKTVDPLAVNVYDVVDRSLFVVSEDALSRLVEVLAK